ncbi:hypothetical protein Thi970DRAFT_00428 [Thiorhodovibrio frisius]|uniref:Uncharacterized protein n=1 Tax=Thiorhodovibrio frisius TaxID=631362 RepID=H8YWG7_9GAMM|nr:hypothetical protein Thi970DRAFT_00428 [Thiorhodovibrio frisius]WPL22950.1 hypothetical protein Thiofri_03130 [Thiorhodovibrio frisius]
MKIPEIIWPPSTYRLLDHWSQKKQRAKMRPLARLRTLSRGGILGTDPRCRASSLQGDPINRGNFSRMDFWPRQKIRKNGALAHLTVSVRLARLDRHRQGQARAAGGIRDRKRPRKKPAGTGQLVENLAASTSSSYVNGRKTHLPRPCVASWLRSRKLCDSSRKMRRRSVFKYVSRFGGSRNRRKPRGIID